MTDSTSPRLTARPALLCGEELLLDGEVIGTLTQAADLTWRFWKAETPRARSLPDRWPLWIKGRSREAVLRHLEDTLAEETSRTEELTRRLEILPPTFTLAAKAAEAIR